MGTDSGFAGVTGRRGDERRRELFQAAIFCSLFFACLCLPHKSIYPERRLIVSVTLLGAWVWDNFADPHPNMKAHKQGTTCHCIAGLYVCVKGLFPPPNIDPYGDPQNGTPEFWDGAGVSTTARPPCGGFGHPPKLRRVGVQYTPKGSKYLNRR